MIPQTQARRRLVLGSLIFFFAQRPKASALPVLLRIPTRPPRRAQKRKILMFHPSVSTSAIKSVKRRSAVTGLPPATISAPDTIPTNSEITTSFVMKARVMVRIGGISPRIPKCSI